MKVELLKGIKGGPYVELNISGDKKEFSGYWVYRLSNTGLVNVKTKELNGGINYV